MSTCFDCMGNEDARKGVELCSLHDATPQMIEFVRYIAERRISFTAVEEAQALLREIEGEQP